MKKIFLIVVLLFTFIFLVACGDEKDQVKETLYINGDSTVEVGSTIKLNAITNIENAVIVWSTSDEKVATVENGSVNGVSEGEVTITVTVKNHEVTANKKIVVNAKPIDYTLTISDTSVELNIGEEKAVTATVQPNTELVWSSANTSVVTVENGKIKAIGEGTTSVTVSTKDNQSSKSITVVVTKVTELTASLAQAKLQEINSEYLNAIGVSFIYTVQNNDDVVEINASYNKTDGVIKALAYASTTSSVYIKDDYAYLLSNDSKVKTKLTANEYTRISTYDFKAIASEIIDSVNDNELFNVMTLVSSKDGISKYKIDTVNYKGKLYNFAGVNEAYMTITIVDNVVKTVQFDFVTVNQTTKMVLNYVSVGEQTIKYPSDLSTYQEQ